MRRFFIGKDAVRDGAVYIEDENDVRHIGRVLRMKPGDSLVVCDGAGREYAGTIEEIGEAVKLSVRDVVRAVEPRTKITLYQCVPKQGKMETAIQKSTELGAVRFAPVFSERSVPRPKDVEKKVGRWQRVAEEASKQSGRATVPLVDAPLSLSEAVETFGEHDLVLFPYEMEDRVTIKEALRRFVERREIEGGGGMRVGDGPREGDEPREGNELRADDGMRAGGLHIAVLIGPEGGFTDAEAFKVEDAGAVPCSLGGTILRTETAGPAAIAMIMYETEL